MLDRLKFVYGAVQERAILPALSHFLIYDGRVQGTDGRMCIDAPMPELAGEQLIVPGDRFMSAIDAAGNDARIDIKDGNVTVKGGRFRARIPTLADGSFPRSMPDAADWELDEPLLPTLRRLRPFIASDAANAWATSMLFTQKSATVTNNVCLATEACTMLAGTGVASISVPAWALDEVIRMGVEPCAFGVSETSITFYFEAEPHGRIWIKTQLISAPWPVERMVAVMAAIPKKMKKTPEGLRAAVEMVAPFCKEPKFPVILFSDKGIATEDGDHFAAVEGFKMKTASFNADMLRLVLTHADHFDITENDKAVFARGPARGILVGLRA